MSIHTVKCIGLFKRPSVITNSSILYSSIHMPLKMALRFNLVSFNFKFQSHYYYFNMHLFAIVRECWLSELTQIFSLTNTIELAPNLKGNIKISPNSSILISIYFSKISWGGGALHAMLGCALLTFT